MPMNKELYRDLYKNARMIVILKLILDLGGCATVAQMAKVLGTHRDGISYVVYRLADRNLVTRPYERSGWYITKLGMNFLKPSPQLVPENPIVVPENPSVVPENPVVMPEKPALAVNTIITTLNKKDSDDIEVEESIKDLVPDKPALAQENPALLLENPALFLEKSATCLHEDYAVVPEKSALPPKKPISVTRKKEIVFDVWRAFTEIGITHNPTSENVAATPGLTYDGVIRKWDEMRAIGKPWKGLLIKIIPTLKPWELRGHSEICRCHACWTEHERQQNLPRRRRYGDWQNE